MLTRLITNGAVAVYGRNPGLCAEMIIKRTINARPGQVQGAGGGRWCGEESAAVTPGHPHTAHGQPAACNTAGHWSMVAT